MPIQLSPYEFSLFSRFMETRTGIEIRENKSYLIETRLTRLITEGGYPSFYRLYRAMCDDPSGLLAERVVSALTTNETFWFRDRTPWQFLQQELLPRFVQELRLGQRQRVRVWSAASATGQEAYSTAMLIDRYLTANHIYDVRLPQFEILATDISPAALEKAKSARYDRIAMTRGLDADIRERYFQPEGDGYRLCDRIRNAVTFRKFNLQDSFAPLGCFDVVFLRYVMIYLSEAVRRDIMDKLARTVRPEGALFLGASELYRDIGHSFSTRRFERSLVYIRSNPPRNTGACTIQPVE